MSTDNTDNSVARHLRITEVSPWIDRFSTLIPAKGRVLDLACGGGRHSRLLLERGNRVVAVDKNTRAIRDRMGSVVGLDVIDADLEGDVSPFGAGGCLSSQFFDGIVVVNYLHRPLLNDLIHALNPGGVLLYETFAVGNEAYAGPRNPDHLLRAGELLTLVRNRLHVVAYEHGLVQSTDIPGVKQRIAATNDLNDHQAPPRHYIVSGISDQIYGR